MTVAGYKRALILAGIAIGLLLVIVWRMAIGSGIQRADEQAAWLAVSDYERTRETALQSEPEHAAEQLHILTCLPPRRTNSSNPLIRIVEKARDRDIRDVIAYLRAKTGEDLGDDPAKWIEKYSKNSRPAE